MRRTTLALLRCPRCLAGPLHADGDQPAVEFGPIRCGACGAVYPLAEGVLDLVAEPDGASPSLAQRVLQSRTVARAYERGVRSAFMTFAARARLDFDSEHLLARSLLAPPPGVPILDLSCGTGAHARRLALLPGLGSVIGLDLSLAMLDEALHHLREANAAVDLIRAEAERLPLLDASVGAVLNVGAFHLYSDPRSVLAEIARVLTPGAPFVCGTVVADLGVVQKLEVRAGVYRRSEEALRALCAAAGLRHFERVLLPPVIVFRVEKGPLGGV